jgi:hypothetical protein
LGASLAIGIAVFAPILHAWFVTDDWEFMILVGTAKSAAVCFAPIVGRYLRPIVMALFYVNYHVFGLNPLPFHFTIVLLHCFNAWFVCLLAERLGLSRLVALGAALMFLVFAGHSEAVSWLGGQSETVAAFLLMPGLLLFDRALTAERSALAITGACLMVALSVLGKETAVVAPGLFLAYGAARLLTPLAPVDHRRTMTRTLTAVAASGGIVVAYLGFRLWMFGTLATYPAVADPRIMFAESRAFLLRTFLPAGRALAAIWVHGYDVVLIGAVALWLVLLFIRRPATKRPIFFLVAGIAIGLAPVLPTSISIVNTVTERYVYLATVFASILTAWLVEVLCGGRRVLAAALMLAIASVNLIVLERANRGWVAAGELARAVTSEMIERVRAVPPTTRTFVLNVPDTAAGKFVVRGAFYATFHLMAPDVASPERRIFMIASTAAPSAMERTRVERTGPRSFTVTPENGVFLQQGVGTLVYTFDRWDPRGYAITFRPAHAIQVLYTSGGHIHTAAVLPGSPLGSLDLPATDAICEGADLRFSGWALWEQRGLAVVVENAARPPAAERIGTAEWKTGTRPDVTAGFPEMPDAERAEWDWMLPCSMVKEAGGRLDVRVVATGSDGSRTELGSRAVTLR